MKQTDLLKLQVIAKELLGSRLDRGVYRAASYATQSVAFVFGALFLAAGVSVATLAFAAPESGVLVAIGRWEHRFSPAALATLGATSVLTSVLLLTFAAVIVRARLRRHRSHALCQRILALKWNVNHRTDYPQAAE